MMDVGGGEEKWRGTESDKLIRSAEDPMTTTM